MARPESAADEVYAALAAEFISAVVAGASARLGTPLRPETSTSSSLPPSALSRPDTGLLREETAQAIESALEGAFSNLQQYGLISDGKPMEEDKAMALLAGLIETWPISDQWKYHLEKRGEEGETLLVEAMFSIPTRRRPIPNATASANFRLTKLPHNEVDISYTLEGQRFKHSGRDVCRDKWLRDILANKRQIQEQFPVA